MLFRNLFLQIFQNCRGGVDADIPHYKNLFQLFIKVLVYTGISAENGVKPRYNIISCFASPLTSRLKSPFFFSHTHASFYLLS